MEVQGAQEYWNVFENLLDVRINNKYFLNWTEVLRLL